MKKWLSALLVVCMVFSLMQGCLAVDADDPLLIIESKKAHPGDTVTLNISVKNNPGFWLALLTPVIASGLPEAKWATTEMTTGLEPSAGLVFEGVPTADHTDMVEDGAVLTVTFTLPQDIARGTYPVSFMEWANKYPKPMDICNYEEKDVVFSVVPGGITVVLPIAGDLDFDEAVTSDDAIYLLMYTFFPEQYPISGDCDFDGDGAVTSDDAIYLLMNTFFPEQYPIGK